MMIYDTKVTNGNYIVSDKDIMKNVEFSNCKIMLDCRLNRNVFKSVKITNSDVILRTNAFIENDTDLIIENCKLYDISDIVLKWEV